MLPACPLTHYVIVRRDLPAGTLVSQVIHAAGESSPGNLPEGTLAVALAVEGELQLLALEQKLKKNNIDFRAIREPDAPWNGQLMAIGIAPCDRSIVKKEVGNLPLLK